MGSIVTVCFQVSIVKPISKAVINGAIIVTERMETIPRNRANSFFDLGKRIKKSNLIPPFLRKKTANLKEVC